jgi:FSR family fosmidomycin resistance protein-like MFS transporter
VLLPYANLFWTGILAVLIAMIMASAFSAILVYAQELLPGLGGLGAAALGKLADLTSITTVYRACPFLLLLGLLTAFLPRRPGAPSMKSA